MGESVSSLLTSILSLGNNTYGYAERLEIHEVTFLEGIFVLYYLFFSPKETKQQRTRNWVLAGCSFFFVLAGMKRILLPALVVSAFYIWVLRRSHAKEKLIMLTGAAWVTLFWVYLYLVHTGAISRLLNAVGINMMGRDYIWSLAKPYYQFSPTFRRWTPWSPAFMRSASLMWPTRCTTISSRCSWNWAFRGCASGVRSCT